MIDKYNYFDNLQLEDFIYIATLLENKNIIKIQKKNQLCKALLEILEEYSENK